MLRFRILIFLVFIVSVYPFISYPSPGVTYATNTSSNSDSIPTAEVVHSTESMKVPPSVGTFVTLIPNEAHENWSDEKHK